jgi:hypothetical protein
MPLLLGIAEGRRCIAAYERLVLDHLVERVPEYAQTVLPQRTRRASKKSGLQQPRLLGKVLPRSVHAAEPQLRLRAQAVSLR